MRQTKILMGMPITIEIVDPNVAEKDIEEIFNYFKYIEDKFSVRKKTSEITKINNKEIGAGDYSEDMKTVFALAEETKIETNGYFDIVTPDGKYDPSGLVKGWAICKAGNILKEKGFSNFYINAGGDIQVFGKNSENKAWKVGIKNPFNQKEIVKIIYLKDQGVATSGTYIRGQHIYNPKNRGQQIIDIVSMTIVGPNIYEADRFATAAFAMGRDGINFVENLEGFEGYMIDKNNIATLTSGFEKYGKEHL